MESMIPDLSLCFEKASQEMGVHKKLLVVVAYVESRLNEKAFNLNRNGTYDIGIMQINSSNIPKLRKKGIIQEERDLWNACKNIRAGAYIMNECIDAYGFNWKAVDCYNKGDRARYVSQYVWKVYSILEKVR